MIIKEKIQKEIDAVIGADRFPSMSDKTLMPYTSAAVIELQRKANIVSMNLPHSVVHDTKVGGISIPKDTIVVPQVHLCII
jgi:cytochrome P450